MRGCITEFDETGKSRRRCTEVAWQGKNDLKLLGYYYRLGCVWWAEKKSTERNPLIGYDVFFVLLLDWARASVSRRSVSPFPPAAPANLALPRGASGNSESVNSTATTSTASRAPGHAKRSAKNSTEQPKDARMPLAVGELTAGVGGLEWS